MSWVVTVALSRVIVLDFSAQLLVGSSFKSLSSLPPNTPLPSQLTLLLLLLLLLLLVSIYAALQSFWLTAYKEIRHVWDLCINTRSGTRVFLGACDALSRGWEYDPNAATVKYSGKCLAGTNSGLSLQPCDGSAAQRFRFTDVMTA